MGFGRVCCETVRILSSWLDISGILVGFGFCWIVMGLVLESLFLSWNLYGLLRKVSE